MDHGWIQTYGNAETTTVQVSIASEGGSGTPVPDLSIEVDNLDETLARIHAAGITLEYGVAEEPWGVRRFFCSRSAGEPCEYFAACVEDSPSKIIARKWVIKSLEERLKPHNLAFLRPGARRRHYGMHGVCGDRIRSGGVLPGGLSFNAHNLRLFKPVIRRAG